MLKLLNDPNETRKSVGLKMFLQKTRVMFNKFVESADITLEDIALEEVYTWGN